MSAPASFVEKSARGISPLLFIAAAVCFLLPFAGVSCNTTAAKPLIESFGGAAGTSSSQLSQTSACLDAINGFNLATYSGLNLAFGSAPSVATTPPSACPSSSSSTPTSLSTDQAKIDIVPLALIGLIVIVLGALLSLILVVRRGRGTALIVALIAAAGLALVLVDQLLLQKRITDKLASSVSSSAGSSLPSGFNLNLSDYFTVNWGIGAFLVMGALAVVIVLNLVAASVSPPRALAAATPAGSATAPAWPAVEPPPPPPPPPAPG